MSIDVDESINSLNITAPCIVAFGASRNNIEDIKIVIETDTIIPVANMATAIHFCFACYYINMSFPAPFKYILLFLEKYVYNLKPSQKLPMSVVLVHDGGLQTLNFVSICI